MDPHPNKVYRNMNAINLCSYHKVVVTIDKYFHIQYSIIISGIDIDLLLASCTRDCTS